MFFLYGVGLLVLVAGSLLYWTRARWTAPLSEAAQAAGTWLTTCQRTAQSGLSTAYTRLPTTFAGDVEAGLSSSTFDLAGNVADGDSRAGLDDASKAAILKIMKKRRLQFDEARRVYMEQRFRDNGIAADGRPRDPKFVSFS